MSAVVEEIWEILREVPEGQKENKEQIRLLCESQEAFKQSKKKTERIIEKIQRETAREIKKVNKNVGRLTDRLGEFVEEAVRPAAVKLFRERGIDVHKVQQNIVVKRDDEGLEIDLLVVNDKDTIAIE